MGTQGAGSAVHCHLRRPRCSTIRTQELAEVLRRSPAGNTLDSRLHSPSLTTCMREQRVRPLHRVAGVLDRLRRRAACGGRRPQQRRARDERSHWRPGGSAIDDCSLVAHPQLHGFLADDVHWLDGERREDGELAKGKFAEDTESLSGATYDCTASRLSPEGAAGKRADPQRPRRRARRWS